MACFSASRPLYLAVIHHGGSLLGLGVWGSTRLFSTIAQAERAGERVAIVCRRVVGGSPTYQVVTEFARAKRVLRAASNDRVLRFATRAECDASDASPATAGILSVLVRGVMVDAYAEVAR